MWQSLHNLLLQGDVKSLARCISYVENEVEGYENFLQSLKNTHVPVIGITGPPGAGKSTLTDALIHNLVGTQGKKVAVLCVDPSSPFNLGALLGDRIRMSEWYTNPQVYIRSLASRGSLGGLHPKIIEIASALKNAPFDYVIIETVGVGQSEIEIAGLADVTIVTVVPEAGDEVQTMKAGLMEIADIFVVNKADREGADRFANNLRLMLAPAYSRTKIEIPVIKTIASQKQGTQDVIDAIKSVLAEKKVKEKHAWLLAEKAWHLIQTRRMKDLDKALMKKEIEAAGEDFNLYQYILKYQ